MCSRVMLLSVPFVTTCVLRPLKKLSHKFLIQIQSAKMSNDKVIKIGTHDGMFHCDEALAVFLLKSLLRYKDAVIVRTRDYDILDTCDVVVDVGRKYDPSTHRYDHHMRDFNESLSTVIKKPGYTSTIKLSSAGLIYCHFGHEILKELVPKDVSDATIEIIFKRIYYELIREIDAIDNGIQMFDGEPLYNISTGLSSRVNRLNPAWNDAKKDVYAQFLKAVELVGEEFLYCLHSTLNIWLPAKCIVENALDKRFELDPSGEIIEIERGVPWQQHLATLEEQRNIEPVIKYVLWEEDNEGYRLRAVPIRPKSFVCRIFLPEAWQGLRLGDLDEVTGIPGCTFVHALGFIGGHQNREGAIEIARKALAIGKSKKQ